MDSKQLLVERTNGQQIEKAIGLTVSKERERQNLTTTELAKKVGISQAQISRLENGKQGFRSSTLERVAHALGVQLLVPYGLATS